MRSDRTMLSSLAAMSVTLTAWGVQPSGSDPSEPPSTSGTSDASPRDSTFSVIAALAELPAELIDEAPLVTMGDVTAVTQAAGVTVPDPTTSDDFVDDYIHWMMAITGISTTPPGDEPEFAPAMVVPPSQLVQMAAMVEDLDAAVGFTFADVEWFADVTFPPSSFSVFGGTFDESTLSPVLVPVGDGIVTLGEGEDLSVNGRETTPLSPHGQPQRLAYSNGRIAVSPDTTLMSAWLAGTDSTADIDDDLLAVATALDEAGVASAALGSLTDFDDALGERVTPEARAAILDRLGDAILDDPFEDAVGIGWSAVDGEPVISIVYSLEDGADADAAMERVRSVFEDGISIATAQPLSDRLVVDDVTSDGSVVVATIHPGPEGYPFVPFRMLSVADLPFVTLDD